MEREQLRSNTGLLYKVRCVESLTKCTWSSRDYACRKFSATLKITMSLFLEVQSRMRQVSRASRLQCSTPSGGRLPLERAYPHRPCHNDIRRTRSSHSVTELLALGRFLWDRLVLVALVVGSVRAKRGAVPGAI